MCIPFGECDELKRIAAKGTLTPQELNLIRSKQCNYVNRSAYVCCAAQNQNGQTNTSPTGNRGNFLPLPPVCGPAFADRIVGGTETDIDEFPWIAQIQYRKADRTIGSHCGGSLINDRFVITAAHCVRKVPQTWQLVQVRLGEYDTRSNPDCNDFITGSVCNDPYVEVAVSQIIVHPEYLADAKHQPNDIALLKLQTAVRYTNYIKPVCLPAPTLRTLDWTGHALEVAGFGKTEFVNSNPVKLKVDVDAFSTVECKNIYKTLPLTDKQVSMKFDSSFDMKMSLFKNVSKSSFKLEIFKLFK